MSLINSFTISVILLRSPEVTIIDMFHNRQNTQLCIDITIEDRELFREVLVIRLKAIVISLTFCVQNSILICIQNRDNLIKRTQI
jgi:hypothetical protein